MKNNSMWTWIGLLVAVIIVVVVWHAGLFSGSMKGGTDADNASVTTTTTPAAHTLDSSTFRYTSYDSNTIPAGENYLIGFDGGNLHGGICDTFTGPYIAKDGGLSANLTFTLKGCTVPKDIAGANQIFHTTFAQPATYTYVGDILTITGSGHTLVFNAFLK